MSDFDNIINDRLNEDDGESFPNREANWDKLSQQLAAFEMANPLNDFDNIVNNRLNEEEGEFFPRREINWDKLSQRLTDFETANPLPIDMPKPVLTAVWKRWAWTSAAAALVGFGGLLFWHFNEVNQLEQRNANLAKEISVLESGKQPLNGDTVVERKVTVETNTTTETTKTIVGQSEKANNPNKETQSPNILSNRKENASVSQKETVVGIEQKQVNTPQNRQNAAVVDNKLNSRKQETGKIQSAKETAIQKRNGSQIGLMDNKNIPTVVPFDKKKAPLNGQKVNLNDALGIQTKPTILDASKANIANNNQNISPISPKTEEENVKTEQKKLDKIEAIVKTDPSVSDPVLDKKESIEPVKTEIAGVEKAKEDAPTKTDIAAVEKTKEDAPVKTDIAAKNENINSDAAATPPIIPPAKSSKWWKALLPKGFAIGANGVYGSAVPEIRGIMPKVGKGISAELNFANHLSLVSNVDILETHFEVRERPQHFRVKEEPNPQKPNVSLHRLKGEQHSRLLSLNAKYVFGQKWFVQPTIFVGHSWQKIDARPVDYVFKDNLTGEETPIVAQAETEKIKGLWQVGAGLEKKIKRWTFGVSAEMQKDFSKPKDPLGHSTASNFGILRGGVKFNIF